MAKVIGNVIVTILGYGIGFIFVVLMLFGPAIGLYFASKDTVKALQYDEKQQAEVIRCLSISTGSGTKVRSARVPEVKLQSGKLVRGTVDHLPILGVCDDQVGKKIEVLYDLDNLNNAKVNTFVEMWFYPLLSLSICLFYYPILIKAWIKKRKTNKKK